MTAMWKSAWAGPVAVFLLAATLRVGLVEVRHGHRPEVLTYPDEEAYVLSARSLAAGNGLIDEFGYRATYMPGYPAFIAVFLRLGMPLMAVRVAQAIVGALVAPATFMLALTCLRLCPPAFSARFPIRGAAWAAGILAAIDPFLLFFSGLLLTESLFTVAFVAFWWLLVECVHREAAPKVCVAAGACLFATAMLRPSSLILLGVAPVVLAVLQGLSRRSVVSGIVLAGTVVVGLSLWGARNASVLGQWRWTTTRGGISLYDGVQPGGEGASDLAHTKVDPAVVGLDELAWDRYWHERAVAAIRENPARMVALAGRKFLRTWNIVPNEENSRRGASAIVSAVWMTLVLLFAAIGLWRLRGYARVWAVLLTPVVAFTLLHMIYVGSVRYRIPLMPMVYVLSAAGMIPRCRTGDARP